MLSLKKFIPVTVALCMMVPVAASAATTADTNNNSARAPYVSEIKQERQTIKANWETNKAIRDAINDKLQKIKTMISEDKANKTLKNIKDAIKAQREVIKKDRADLKAVNTTLKADRDKVKSDKTNKDYEALAADLNAIPPLQTSKTPLLQKLSGDLDALLNILNGGSTVNQQ